MCNVCKQDCGVAVPMYSIRQLARREGIELQGDDGQPYHCGERMRVGSGIAGPHYARCKCGLEVGNLASPHIAHTGSTAVLWNDGWFDAHKTRTWIRMSPMDRKATGG
jgi:hypothetical protein